MAGKTDFLEYIQFWLIQILQAEDQFHFDVGGYNPILEKAMERLLPKAAASTKARDLVCQKQRRSNRIFRTTGGTAPSNDLFDDVDISWKRVKGGDKIERFINETIASFDFMQPQKSVPQLVQLYKQLKQLPIELDRTKNEGGKRSDRVLPADCGLKRTQLTICSAGRFDPVQFCFERPLGRRK